MKCQFLNLMPPTAGAQPEGEQQHLLLLHIQLSVWWASCFTIHLTGQRASWDRCWSVPPKVHQSVAVCWTLLHAFPQHRAEARFYRLVMPNWQLAELLSLPHTKPKLESLSPGRLLFGREGNLQPGKEIHVGLHDFGELSAVFSPPHCRDTLPTSEQIWNKPTWMFEHQEKPLNPGLRTGMCVRQPGLDPANISHPV